MQWDGYAALRDAGLSIRAVASALGVSPTTIQKYLLLDTTNDDGSIEVPMRRGIDGKVRPGRQFDTSHRDQQIWAMHDDKLTIRQIASAAGCSPGTVHRVLKKVAVGP